MDVAAKEAVLVQLQLDEGFRGVPYRDPLGVLTIGYGHNLGVPISRRAAAVILEEDLEAALLAAETFSWFAGLTPARQAVVVNMLFNLGLTKFLGFRRMLQALVDGDYTRAAVEMRDSKWYSQVPVRADRLAREMAAG